MPTRTRRTTPSCTAAWLLVAAIAAVAAAPARAEPRTVCTITVNSPDEKEAMRRHLPKGDYRFVELVEHGRPDWLASACRSQVKCDVLVVSGHFNGHDFFSDKVEASEYLPVAEMERASCSNSCPGLFSQLKEVYLFGCTSLSPEAALNPAGEIERTLIRAGAARADAQRIAQASTARHGESNRDVMRRVFAGVPAIYGFSAVAPLGPVSGGLIDRYFRGGGRSDFGSGRASRGMLGTFAAHSMTVVPGLRATDPQATYRAEVCRFVDDRGTPAQKLRFIHALLGRGMAEARLFFEHIEGFFASLDEAARDDAQFQAAQAELAADADARARYLAYVRDNDQPDVRSRMLTVGRDLGWLDDDQYRAEVARMLGDMLAQRTLTTADIALACRVNADGALDAYLPSIAQAAPAAGGPGRAALLACLGSADDRARMLAALASTDDDDARAAEVYFAQRPLAPGSELRDAVAAVADMPPSDAQVRALDTLARQPALAADSVALLVDLFERTRSARVQRAVAGVLVRADRGALAAPHIVPTLRRARLHPLDGEDMIDILLRRLEPGYAMAGAGAAIEAVPVRQRVR